MGIIASTVAGGISQTANDKSSHAKRHVDFNNEKVAERTKIPYKMSQLKTEKH